MKRKYIPAKIRRRVYERDNFTCVYCGVRAYEEPLEIDHVIPISMGGSNNINNLVTSCRRCNRKKHDHLPNQEGIFKVFMQVQNSELLANIKDTIKDTQITESKTDHVTLLPLGLGTGKAMKYAYWGGVLDRAKELADSGDEYEISLVMQLLKRAYDLLSQKPQEQNESGIENTARVSAYNGNHSSYKGNSLTVATA